MYSTLWRARRQGERPEIYGRERERAQLREMLEDAIAGRGSLVLVSGEAGIGKTTLVDDLINQAKELGFLVLTGGCYDLMTTPPYGPWTEILGDYPATGELPLIPDFLSDSDGLEQIGSREQLFRIIASFVADIAATAPLVLVLEDLHWADHASIELLRYLARQLAAQRMLMVASYREDELTPDHPLFASLPLLVREARAERLELQPFDSQTLDMFIESRYPLADDERQALGTYLLKHTEGNPLFAAELLRSLERERVLIESEQGWRLGGLDEIVPPPLVVQMIERQLATLEPGTREALEIAAVLGQEIEPVLWGDLAGLDSEELSTAIEQALIARLTEQFGRSGLRFRHALIREVLYQGMALPKRMQTHRRVAEVLAESAAPEPDRIAFHFRQANDSRVVEWLIRAGERAQRAYAHTVAAERFEAALNSYIDNPENRKDRAWLAWRISQMLAWSDEGKRVHYLELASRFAQEAGEQSLVAICCSWRARQFGEKGEGRYAIEEFERGVQLWNELTIDERLDAIPRVLIGRSSLSLVPQILPDAKLMSRLGQIYPGTGSHSSWLAHVGRFEEAIIAGEELIAKANALDFSPELHFMVCSGGYGALAVSYAAIGEAEKSDRMFEFLSGASHLHGSHVPRLVQTLMHYLYVHLPYATDNLTQRRILFDAAAEDISHVEQAFPHMVSGMPWFKIIDGSWHEAESLINEYLNRPVPWSWRLPFLSLTCWLERHTGEPDIAWSRIHECLPAGPRTEPGDEQYMFVAPLLRRAVELSLDAEDPERALAWLQAHDHWLDWSGALTGQAQARLLWARYWLQSGDLAAARQEAMRAVDIASHPRQPLNLLASHRFLGELDILERRFDEAEHHLAVSLDLAEASAIPYERVQCLLAMAKLQAARGDHATPRPLLDEVRQVAQSLGATLLLSQVNRLERRLPGASYPARLSAREVEVLRLVAKGLSDAEIAARLFISPRTVNRHTQSIYNKLGVNSRVAATRFALDHQLT